MIIHLTPHRAAVMSEHKHTPGPWILSTDELDKTDYVIRGIALDSTSDNKNQIHDVIDSGLDSDRTKELLKEVESQITECKEPA